MKRRFSSILVSVASSGLWLALAAAVILAATGAPSASAQGGKGSISGRVMDMGNGILQGAQITVDPEGATAVADIQGQFLVVGLNPGRYTVTVTYAGFAPGTKSVTVSNGQVANVEFQLAVESQNSEVLVTAERAAGEAEQVNRQIAADNLVQVLSADVIRSLPNANLADALGRLPSVTLERDEGEGKYVQVRGTEPRLTNVTIDGINVPSPENFGRQIKLDAIPADIVESVEINKTLQANMDADGLPGRSDNPRLLRSAPNTWNISPTYDRGRLSVRAGFSYNQANIFQYLFQDGTPIAGVSSPVTPGGINGPNSDNYLYSHLEIDIQGSYRLSHGLSFVMYGLNLNNDVFGFYNGSTQYWNQREYYRPSVAAGFRWSPLHEK